MRFLAKSRLSANRYKTAEGYLVCLNCILSKVGTQRYRRGEFDKDADNPYDMCDVIRTEANVFEPEAMASFENKPLTFEHPSGMVNLDNFKELSKGFVRDIRRGKDGDIDVMVGDIVVTDKATIEAIESGRMTELSCGYDAEVELIDGKFIQTKIRGNHIALVDEGRAHNARIVDSKPEEDAKAMLTVQCYIFNKDSILVQHRVGPVWKGIAVPGGHVNVGETPEQACIREVKEETGLDVSDLQVIGTHQYHCEKDGDCIALLYKTSSFSGELKDSDEGHVEWMPIDVVFASNECADGFKEILRRCLAKSVELNVRRILSKYNTETSSKISLFETKPGTFVEHYDDETVDFSTFKYDDESTPRYSFSITGGLNGSGEWVDYLDDLQKAFEELETETGLKVIIQDIVNDVADDVWTAKVFLVKPTVDSDTIHKVKELGETRYIEYDDTEKKYFIASGDSRFDLGFKTAEEAEEFWLKNKDFIRKTVARDSCVHDIMPKTGETRVDFIGRAMSELKNEYPDQQQRLAVAYAYWKKAQHKDAAEADYKIKFKPGLGGHCEVYCGTRFVGSADNKSEAMMLIKEDRRAVKDAGPSDARFLLADLKTKLYFAEPNRWVADKSKATRFTYASAKRKQHELGNTVAIYNEATRQFTDSVKLVKYAKYASLVAKLPK